MPPSLQCYIPPAPSIDSEMHCLCTQGLAYPRDMITNPKSRMLGPGYGICGQAGLRGRCYVRDSLRWHHPRWLTGEGQVTTTLIHNPWNLCRYASHTTFCNFQTYRNLYWDVVVATYSFGNVYFASWCLSNGIKLDVAVKVNSFYSMHLCCVINGPAV